jgi:hypothetical protein
MYPVPYFKKLNIEISDDYDGHCDREGHDGVGNDLEGERDTVYIWSNEMKDKLNTRTKEVN